MKANFSAAIVFNYKDDVLIPMGKSVNSPDEIKTHV